VPAHKKPYPRNNPLRIALAQIEHETIRRDAAAQGKTTSDVGHELLRNGGLLERVAFYFPDDAPKLANKYTGNSESHNA
jgi:hypothetical protein